MPSGASTGPPPCSRRAARAATTVPAAANFSRPSTPGRSPRFQAISGAITITAATGAISGTKVS